MLMLITSAPELMEMLKLAFSIKVTFELSNFKQSYFELSNFDESYFELSNFKQSYFELSKLTLIPGGKVAMLLAVRNCSEVGRTSPRGARRPLRIPGEYK